MPHCFEAVAVTRESIRAEDCSIARLSGALVIACGAAAAAYPEKPVRLLVGSRRRQRRSVARDRRQEAGRSAGNDDRHRKPRRRRRQRRRANRRQRAARRLLAPVGQHRRADRHPHPRKKPALQPRNRIRADRPVAHLLQCADRAQRFPAAIGGAVDRARERKTGRIELRDPGHRLRGLSVRRVADEHDGRAFRARALQGRQRNSHRGARRRIAGELHQFRPPRDRCATA